MLNIVGMKVVIEVSYRPMACEDQMPGENLDVVSFEKGSTSIYYTKQYLQQHNRLH